MSDAQVLTEIRPAGGGQWAFATLNQEKSLNALSQIMIDELTARLEVWEKDPQIVGVVLAGAGEKAFCAGGDIRMLYEAMLRSTTGKVYDGASRFFKTEYYLDHLIHRYKKPVVCLGHGIVMGGGLGLMAGASHRVLSERSTIAMPEITIGLYPDVGASYFLNRMPAGVGLYLGLTGTRLKAADALFVGLGDFYIERSQHPKILEKILSTSWKGQPDVDRKALSALLKGLQAPLPASELERHLPIIRELTSGKTILEIWKAFENYNGNDEWVLAGKKSLMAGSPTSAHVIFEQLKRAKNLSLEDCFKMEYDISNQFTRHPDFREGIRALLVDKDLKPRWTPATIDQVTPQYVEEHFQPLN